MRELLAVAFPSAIGFLGVLLITASFAAMLAWPRHLLMGLLACLVLLAQSSSYGLEDATDANVFYVKGSRTFFFTFIEMGLVTGWLVTLARNLWQRDRSASVPVFKYFVLLGLLLLGHFLVGLADPNHFSLLDLGQRGVSNLLWQGMFVYMLATHIRTEKDLRDLALLLLVCLALRQGFGVVRYLALGGDPQNAYATLEASKVKITFWDINDSLWAAFAMGFCAWRALAGDQRSFQRRAAWAIAALVVIVTTVLTARRTAQGGMLLALLAVAWMLPRGRRWPLGLAAVLALPLIAAVLANRSVATSGGWLERILIDVKIDPLADPRRTRFHEWATAWQTLKESLLFGVGPSGSFKVTDHVGLEYHQGRYDFVHSGFGHIFLKLGLVGLLTYFCLLGSWARTVREAARASGEPARSLFVGSIAGAVASIPTLVSGTPISELRTMLVLSVFMAIPVILQRRFVPAASRAANHSGSGSSKRAGVAARAFSPSRLGMR